MSNWSIERLRSIDNVDFAIAMLEERRSTLRSGAPLARKCAEAVKTLEGLKPKPLCCPFCDERLVCVGNQHYATAQYRVLSCPAGCVRRRVLS
jgi:hypothetical protein